MFKLLLRTILILSAIWVVGFGVFISLYPIDHLRRFEEQPQLDGLVILTGPGDRIPQGFAYSRRMPDVPVLISGVHPRVEMMDIAALVDEDVALPADLTLGKQADTTQGNVQETLAWAKARGMRHIGLITADFHTPRSWVLFTLFAPELSITVLPVPTQIGFYMQVREYAKLWLAPVLE